MLTYRQYRMERSSHGIWIIIETHSLSLACPQEISTTHIAIFFFFISVVKVPEKPHPKLLPRKSGYNVTIDFVEERPPLLAAQSAQEGNQYPDEERKYTEQRKRTIEHLHLALC